MSLSKVMDANCNMDAKFMSKSDKDLDLDAVIRECDKICNIHVRGHLQQSIQMAEERRHQHFIFHFFHALFHTMDALITADTDAMNEAIKMVAEALKEIDGNRRKKSLFSSYFSTPNYDEYEEEEVQAEILFLFLTGAQSVLVLVQEKSILGLIKAGFMARNCLSILNECEQILRKRKKWKSNVSREMFKGAVLNTIGCYKLLISLSPPRILRLLLFLGFDANRTKALSLIESVAFGTSLFRYISCFELLGYHLQVEVLAGLGNFDEQLVDRVMNYIRPQIEGSGFLLMFEGIYEKIKGSPTRAIQKLTESSNAFESWIEWKSVCSWYIMWNHAIQRQWEEAIKCIDFLRASCKWSPCVFTYQAASFKAMLLDDLVKEQKVNFDKERAVEISKLRDEIETLLEEAPKLKRTVVGKTLLLEKFVTKRCQIYFQEKEQFSRQNSNSDTDHVAPPAGDLMLPAVEQLIFWNIISMSKRSPLLKDFVDMIDEKLASEYFMELNISNVSNLVSNDGHDSEPSSMSSVASDCNIDNNLKYEKFFNLLLMKGVIYHNMDKEDDAVNILVQILENERVLNLYKHVAPLAALELGLIFKDKALQLIDMETSTIKKEDAMSNRSIFKVQRRASDKNEDKNDDIEELLKISETYLNRSTNNYSKYLNETTLHMRAYNALTIIDESRKKRNRRAKDKKSLNRENSHASIASLLLI